MKKPDDPQIVDVDRTDNAAVVEFKGEPEPAIYPARLLHAAKELGQIMHDKDEEEQTKKE